jgi:hypothetical protein
MLVAAMPQSLWLVRPRRDGGRDFVSFEGDSEQVEMREGSHLPPQMPLLKRRSLLPLAEAERQRRHLQKHGGYQCSEPLF